MNLDMWEDLKVRVSQKVLDIMEDIEASYNVSVDPDFVMQMIDMFDVDGVVEMDMIFPENGLVMCNVFYDPDHDEMKDLHWKRLLSLKSREIMEDMEEPVDFTFRRKKRKPFVRRLRS